MLYSLVHRQLENLFEKKQGDKKDHDSFDQYTGSDSAMDLFPEEQYIHYNGVIDNKMLRKWLEKKTKMQKLIAAPLLISTIDHLIPATEGTPWRKTNCADATFVNLGSGAG